MRRIIMKIASLSLTSLLGVIILGVHAGAMPQQSSHGSNGMDHRVNTSSCSTVCNLTVHYKDDFTDEQNEDDDGDPDKPYYIQFQSSPIAVLQKNHNAQTKFATNLEPPPGMPAYIELAVFRA